MKASPTQAPFTPELQDAFPKPIRLAKKARGSDRWPEPQEKDVQAGILQAATLCGWKLWHIDPGATRKASKGAIGNPIGLPPAGYPDLIGIGPGGRFVGIEVKSPGKQPRDEQLAFLASINKAGGLAAWFDDPKQAIHWMRRCNAEYDAQTEPQLKKRQPKT